MSERRLTYSFGPLEQHGLLGPVRAGQLAVVALGACTAIVTLDHSPDPAGVMVGALVIALATALAFLPLAGRTAEQWTPVMVRFLARSARRRTRFRSPAPHDGFRSRRTSQGTIAIVAPGAATPPQLRGVAITEVRHRELAIGALAEQRGRRLTAVLACRVSGFSLLDPEAQERRLARWGIVLSGASTTDIRRLQWIERTAPARGDELARWLHDERDPAVPLRGAPMVESYLELIGTTAQATREHEILLAIQVDSRHARSGHRAGPQAALVEATERVAKGLEAAEVVVLGALSPGQLAHAMRTAFDPYGRAELAAAASTELEVDGLPEHGAWPVGCAEHWDHYRSDGALHATYWIAGWPRIEVSPLFMSALLGRSDAVRAVSVTFEPLSPERSTRQVEAAVTRDRADRELRARFGQAETARQRQAHDAARRRETELASGHGEVRLSGYVTVSGRNEDELARSCSEVHDHAARSHLELHRLYGQQADAFTFTLPLGRGLR